MCFKQISVNFFPSLSWLLSKGRILFLVFIEVDSLMLFCCAAIPQQTKAWNPGSFAFVQFPVKLSVWNKCCEAAQSASVFPLLTLPSLPARLAAIRGVELRLLKAERASHTHTHTHTHTHALPAFTAPLIDYQTATWIAFCSWAPLFCFHLALR